MKTEVLALNKLFGGTVRYVVPNYQRPYVWGQDRHWEPLLSDLTNMLERQQAGNPLGHFMGAVVLQQENTQPGEVPRHLVIDGQQRLTTLQILMRRPLTRRTSLAPIGRRAFCESWFRTTRIKQQATRSTRSGPRSRIAPRSSWS